jgi:hypothetical protein
MHASRCSHFDANYLVISYKQRSWNLVHPLNSLWMRSALFWDITQRMVTIPYWRFGTTYESHLKGREIQGESRYLTTYQKTNKPMNKSTDEPNNDQPTNWPND